MKDGFIVSRFNTWDRVDEVRALFRTGLGETSQEYWLWKYCQPNGLPQPKLWVVKDTEDCIVATFGTQALPYRRGETSHIVVQLQDLVVAPQCRGFGFTRVLYHTAMDDYKADGGKAFVAYSNEASIGPFSKYGAVIMDDIGAIESKKHYPLITGKTHYEKNGWSFVFSETMPDDIYFTESEVEFKLVKSPKYMKWRFDHNPDGHFRWLSVREAGRLIAWFVFQENHGRIHTAINIYDYDFHRDFSEDCLRNVVKVLSKRGNWVSLWGRMSKNEKERWKTAGLTNESSADSHFLLHYFDGSTPPQGWRILRCDRDF